VSYDLTWSRRTIPRGAAAVGAGVLAGGLGSGPDAALAQMAPATADEALKRLDRHRGPFEGWEAKARGRSLRPHVWQGDDDGGVSALGSNKS